MQYREEKSYRVYVTDALRLVSENTSRYAGGSYFKARWLDSMSSKPKIEKTGAQIAADVIQKCGLKLKK